MTEQRSYAMKLTVNNRAITEVVVDSHYEENHPDIDDALILILVKELDGKEFQPDTRSSEWEFFTLDQIEHQDKRYRLVWCLQDQSLFLGVINCFRR